MGARKLTWDEVRLIRQLYANGEGNLPSLAQGHGVRVGTIWRLIHNETWHDPEYTPPVHHPLSYYLGNPKLSWEKVRAIRARYAAGGVTQKRLAAEYGVVTLTIGEIIRNVSWVDSSYTPPSR